MMFYPLRCLTELHPARRHMTNLPTLVPTSFQLLLLSTELLLQVMPPMMLKIVVTGINFVGGGGGVGCR